MALFLNDYSPSHSFKKSGTGSREKFAVHLMGLLASLQDGKVIFVDGEWGSGKTTFQNQFVELLETEGWSFAQHDAFKSDYAEEPFLPLMADFMTLYREVFEVDSKIEEIAEKSKKVLRKLAVVGGRVGMRALTLNAFGKQDAEDVALILKGAMNDTSSFGGELVDEMLSGKSESEFKQFRDQMKGAALAIAEKNKGDEGKEEQVSKPVLVLVDELDRCRPDYAIQLLERVKHLFDVPGLSFVFFLNMDSLAKGVERIYGDIDGRLYLQKFSDFTTKLPELRSNDVKILNRLRRYHSLSYAVESLQEYGAIWGLPLRSQERAADRICIAHHLLQSKYGGSGVNLGLLAFLIEKIPNDMSKWASGGRLEVSSVAFIWLTGDFRKKSSFNYGIDGLRSSLAKEYSSSFEHSKDFLPEESKILAELEDDAHFSGSGNRYLRFTREAYEAMTVLTSPEHH